MTTVRYNPDPAAPPELSPEQEAFQQALSPDEIEWLAASDPDNPPSSDEELDRGVAAREVRLVREKTGLSQHRFAERYRIDPALLREVEEGRLMPNSALVAYLRVIDREPDAVARALSAA
jgi:putative transcriptional regulator